jgi:hypothetical protein
MPVAVAVAALMAAAVAVMVAVVMAVLAAVLELTEPQIGAVVAAEAVIVMERLPLAAPG